jgi:hypothetical protein
VHVKNKIVLGIRDVDGGDEDDHKSDTSAHRGSVGSRSHESQTGSQKDRERRKSSIMAKVRVVLVYVVVCGVWCVVCVR